MNRIAVKSIRRRGALVDRKTAVTESRGRRAASRLVLGLASSYSSAEVDVRQSLLNYYRPGLNVLWLILFFVLFFSGKTWTPEHLGLKRGFTAPSVRRFIFFLPRFKKFPRREEKLSQGYASLLFPSFPVRARISEHSSALIAGGSRV